MKWSKDGIIESFLLHQKKAEPAKIAVKVCISSITAPPLAKGEESKVHKPEQWTKVASEMWERDNIKVHQKIIIITKQGDISYADILRKLNASPVLWVDSFRGQAKKVPGEQAMSKFERRK